MKNKKDKLPFFVKCSFCNGSFSPEDLVVLEQSERQTVFHALCAHCHQAIIIFLSFTPGGLVSLGLITDLNREEARRFFGQEAVSADEVIDLHEFIFKNPEGLSELVKEAK
jgi:hypothetical protein